MKGTLTREDLTGPLQGRSIADLVREIDRGNAYVNVHTEQYPDGEIRGQVVPELKTMATRKSKTVKKVPTGGKRKAGVKTR